VAGRLSINLASEPFRKDRPILVASVLTGLLMTAVLVMLVSLIWFERGEVSETVESVQKTEKQLRTLSAEQARLDAVLREPKNAEVLERSLFLNSLLLRKGISWTRIFSDLEQVLPYNVKLISIRPQVNTLNEIQLDMIVAAKSSEPVIELLKGLESSPLFGATAVSNWLPPSQTEPLFRYRVTVNYAQKL
jgi:Tfp pilus assembly protein PilN